MRTIILAILLTSGCGDEGPPAPVESNAAVAAETAPSLPQSNAVGSAVASTAGKAAEAAHPCRVQEGRPLAVARVRAIGTEPFWGARTDGRCVTYSTPEDQAGTRVWAKVETPEDRTVWTGALRGKPFTLTVRPMAGCSDGMSDNAYPFEARVLVDGEERRGCADELPTGR